MDGLKLSEIHWVVSDYIGVAGGYLGDFTHATHREFYAAFCDLSLDVDSFPGRTMRERFLAILTAADPPSQAAILIGVARRFPPGSEIQRTSLTQRRLLSFAKRCREIAAVGHAEPTITSEVVQKALAEATTLLSTHGPTSAVDRVHTALHGYLRTVCRAAELDLSALPSDPRITVYFKVLRQQHPALKDLGAQDEAMKSVFLSLANILKEFDTIRNNASLAHANEVLLGRHEALLVINVARATLQYLDAKLRVAPA
jgi:hypothetical protein